MSDKKYQPTLGDLNRLWLSRTFACAPEKIEYDFGFWDWVDERDRQIAELAWDWGYNVGRLEREGEHTQNPYSKPLDNEARTCLN